MARPLILASSSPYRRNLLQQLRIPFDSAAPHIKEEALPGEQPRALARRLAQEKALALAADFPDALIIGSDQVAECEGRALGKPGSRERAITQLESCNGKRVHFHTGISVLDTASGHQRTEVETFTVYFRNLTEDQIRRYVELEAPYDCAGSFKVEGLGIALFEKMEGSDMNSLVGLPLIRLVDLLQEFGINPLVTRD
ncbi:Maf-like protein [Microbulbifer donghaiensis]|uniref:7-methyl-GTP pyrophosphatase n=1 Tax=Microbulbifer donghaiensis TaxID=494016 RepID=A0A1M4V930_9GAMM|nr:nucleoside triphosphate pyrophosphatase [Microbulbifer donghaiensis]SHE65464.1 Maf-like protein [Microbulbifer donghaiensis]